MKESVVMLGYGGRERERSGESSMNVRYDYLSKLMEGRNV